MNRRKNLLCVFFLVLTVLGCAFEAGASLPGGGRLPKAWTAGGAVSEGGDSASPANGNTSSSPANGEKPGGGQTAPDKPAQTTPVSSQPPAVSSSRPPSSAASSKAKTTRRRSSSAASASSALASGWSSSEAVSSEIIEAQSAISLPGVGSVAENDPLSSAITNPAQAHRMNVQGLLAWACIVLGVFVVLIVVLSNRRPPRGPGRKRYRRQKRGSGKHLLNDRYYRDLNRY